MALSQASKYVFGFYAKQFDLENVENVLFIPGEKDPEVFLAMLCEEHLMGPMWIVFNNKSAQRTVFLAKLSALAPQTHVWANGDAIAVRLDLSNSDFCSSSFRSEDSVYKTHPDTQGSYSAWVVSDTDEPDIILDLSETGMP